MPTKGNQSKSPGAKRTPELPFWGSASGWASLGPTNQLSSCTHSSIHRFSLIWWCSTNTVTLQKGRKRPLWFPEFGSCSVSLTLVLLSELPASELVQTWKPWITDSEVAETKFNDFLPVTLKSWCSWVTSSVAACWFTLLTKAGPRC